MHENVSSWWENSVVKGLINKQLLGSISEVSMDLLPSLQGCICFQCLGNLVCSIFSDKVLPETGKQ